MFRPLLCASVLLFGVFAGTAVGVATAAVPTDAAVTNESTATAFDIEFTDSEIADGESATLAVSGVDAGQTLVLATDAYPPSLLARMVDGEPTADGVRLTVPENQTIPVDFRPVDCRAGEREFTAQRLDTGETASTRLDHLREDAADASFIEHNHTTEQGGVVPIPVETECNGFGLHIWDTDSAFNATVTVDGHQRLSTVYFDTAHSTNGSRAVRAGLGTNLTSTTVTAPPDRVSGRYRMQLFFADSLPSGVDHSRLASLDVFTPPTPLTVAPPANDSTRHRTNASAFDIELESDLYAGPDYDDDRTPLRVSGVEPETRLALTADPYSPSLLARMVDGTVTARSARVTVPANRTILVDSEPVTCRPTDFTLTAQRLDTGERASTEGSAVTQLDLDRTLTQESYRVRSGQVLPVTVETNCHEAGIRIWDPDSSFNATVVAENDDRTVTFWLDTAAGNVSQFVRPSVGDWLTNVSGSVPLVGQYRIAAGAPVVRDGRLGFGPADSAPLVVDAATTDQQTTDETTPSETTTATPATTDPDSTPVSPADTPRMPDSGSTSVTTDTPHTTVTGATPTTTGTGPGFGLVVTAATLLAVALLAGRRY